MLESGWIFIGRVAFGWTVLTLLGAVFFSSADDKGDALATIGGVVGFVLWGIWTFGALNVEVVDGTGTATVSHPELAIVGVMLALVPGYIALTGPIELISRARDTRPRDL